MLTCISPWCALLALAAPTNPLELKPAILGQADAPAGTIRREGDAVILTGGGRESYGYGDGGTAFAHVTTKALHFTFTARVARAPEGTPNPKYGIALRTGLRESERMVTARFDGYAGNRAIQWFFRHEPGRSTHDGSRRLYHSGVERALTAREGFWLRLERRYPTITLSWRLDDEPWRPVGGDYHFALLERTVQVGLHLAAGGDGKRPVSATFEHVELEEGPRDADLTPADYREYRPPVGTWQMFLIQADTPEGDDSHSFFILKPRAMPWSQVRGLFYTTGSKEIMLQGRRKMEWESGAGRKTRRPVGMKTWEGVLEIPDLRAWYSILEEAGLVRLGGAGHYKHLEQGLRELALLAAEPRIERLPIVATGASAAGGATASAANLYPEKFVATAPNLIGQAGWETEDPRALQTPRLYVFGSQDTGGRHLKGALATDQVLRERGALWAHAPTWMGYHVWWRSDQIIVPYLLHVFDLRCGASPEPAAKSIAALKEENGWLGLHDTWETNHPRVLPWAQATDAQRRGDTSWLPDEYTARAWQAYVSYWPRTVIHFPRFDGNEGFGFTRPEGREIHFLPAGEPWSLLASGPVGEGVSVDYYDGTRKLRVLRTHRDNPYLAQIEPLEEGLHLIHAITTVRGETEISHAHPILFRARTP